MVLHLFLLLREIVPLLGQTPGHLMVGHLLLVILKVHTSQHPSTVPQQFRQTDTETEYRVSQHPSVVPQQFRLTDTETEYRLSEHPSTVSQQFRLTDRVQRINIPQLFHSNSGWQTEHWSITTSLNCSTVIQTDRQSTEYHNIPQLFDSNSCGQTENRASHLSPVSLSQQFRLTEYRAMSWQRQRAETMETKATHYSISTAPSTQSHRAVHKFRLYHCQDQTLGFKQQQLCDDDDDDDDDDVGHPQMLGWGIKNKRMWGSMSSDVRLTY